MRFFDSRAGGDRDREQHAEHDRDRHQLDRDEQPLEQPRAVLQEEVGVHASARPAAGFAAARCRSPRSDQRSIALMPNEETIDIAR